MYQLRNLISRRNVVKDPKQDFNACEDFFKLIVIGHILAAVMKELGMTNPDEVPSADFLQEDSWLSPDKKREEALNKVCEIFFSVENYCNIKFNTDFVNDELEIDYVQLYAF